MSEGAIEGISVINILHAIRIAPVCCKTFFLRIYTHIPELHARVDSQMCTHPLEMKYSAWLPRTVDVFGALKNLLNHLHAIKHAISLVMHIFENKVHLLTEFVEKSASKGFFLRTGQSSKFQKRK